MASRLQVYLSVLEGMKGAVMDAGHRWDVAETTLAGAANFAGGACASLATQSVVVPIDVVSQRQMTYGQGTASAPSQASSPAQPGNPRAKPSDVHHPPKPAAMAADRPAVPQAGPTAASAPPAHGRPNGKLFSTLAAAQRSPPIVSAAQAVAQAQVQAAQERSLSHYSASSTNAASRGSVQSVLDNIRRRKGLGAAFSATHAASQRHRGFAAVAEHANMSGLQMARFIIAQEGVKGLYKGFGVSVALFVPSSALWWGAYGTYQRLIWNRFYHQFDHSPGSYNHQTWEVALVQSMSAALAGCTSGILTNPLDLVKTRMQVSRGYGAEEAGFRSILGRIWQEGGVTGLFRGSVPRCINAALWGTCMVSAYEFLKRICATEDGSESRQE